MITVDMGYKQISSFYKDTLRPKYTKDIDYSEITKDDELIKKYEEYIKIPNGDKSPLGKKVHTGGKTQKHYKITGKAFKKMLMTCGTKKGDQICEYYLKVEQLAIFMKDYIVALHSYLLQKQLEAKDTVIKDAKVALQAKDVALQAKDTALNRINRVNLELLTFKKLNEKNESIYIVATYRYATQGIFKVGRTKCMKARTSGHNTTHIAGDKVKVLKEFKVNDSIVTENYIHRKLKGLLVHDEKEFFLCPYDLLENIIEVIISNDDAHNNLINSIIDTVYQLKCSNYSIEHWMNGIDTAIFREEYQLVSSDYEVKVAFDVTSATEAQKKAFVAQCVQSYKITIEEPNKIMWKTFQAFLITQLNLPRYKFKALEWKPRFNEATIQPI
jgi:phage anti-repressor protein